METVIEILKEEGFEDNEVLAFKACKKLISYKLQPYRLSSFEPEDFDKGFEVIDFWTKFKSIVSPMVNLLNGITVNGKFLPSLAFLTQIVEWNKFSYLEETVTYLVSQRNA